MGTQKYERQVVNGILEVQFRLPNSKTLKSLLNAEPHEYVKVGGVLPLAEFDTINDAVDLFHYAYSNFGLPRALSRLDMLVTCVKGYNGVAAYIMIDPDTDMQLIQDTQEHLGDRLKYYGEDGGPLHIVPIHKQWEIKTR